MKSLSPATPFYWLDSVAGWRGTWTGMEQNADTGSLSLDALPSLLRQIFVLPDDLTPCVQTDAVACPIALTADPCHGVFLADAATASIFRGDVTKRAIAQIASLPAPAGGSGSLKPQGIALLSDGSIAVLDRAAHRVLVYSPDPGALLAGVTFSSAVDPVSVAAGSHSNILVLDAAGKQVLAFDREGNPEAAPAIPPLNAPSVIATSRNAVAVLDGSNIALVPEVGVAISIALPQGYRYEALTFDEDGSIYVGATPVKGAEGSILRVAFDETGQPVIVGFGALGVEGRAIALTNLAGHGLIAILYNAVARTSSIWLVDRKGASASSGVFTSELLDSRIDRCSWHRIVCEGSIPAGTVITLQTLTVANPNNLNWDTASQPLTIAGTASLSVTDPDYLVQSGPNRYLAFRLVLTSSVPQSPIITGIRVEFPRTSYLQYLPAVLQEDPESRFFLERFLSLFQTYNDGQDDRIDNFSRLFSATSAPEAYLGWLAAVVGQPMDPSWAVSKRRRMLQNLFHYDPATDLVTGRYPARGTVKQVRQDVLDYSGVDSVEILEHFRLRSWLSDTGLPLDGTAHLWSASIYRRLQVAVYSQLGYFRLLDQPEPALEPLAWGANTFSVFFHADTYTWKTTRDKVARAVNAAKPAHTKAQLCAVLPRMRVEYQATVGVDTVLGEPDEMVLGQIATLDYDAVLAQPAAYRSMDADGAAIAPRAGLTTTLL
jgi:phage tail-like protein